MSKIVLDSSALLALIFNENGADIVRAVAQAGVMSTVNLAEVVTKLVDHGMSSDEAGELLSPMNIEYAPLSENQALICAGLRGATRSRGLSLGDRACLALARERGLKAMTADSAWMGLTDVEVVSIR